MAHGPSSILLGFNSTYFYLITNPSDELVFRPNFFNCIYNIYFNSILLYLLHWLLSFYSPPIKHHWTVLKHCQPNSVCTKCACSVRLWLSECGVTAAWLHKIGVALFRKPCWKTSGKPLKHLWKIIKNPVMLLWFRIGVSTSLDHELHCNSCQIFNYPNLYLVRLPMAKYEWNLPSIWWI